MSSSKSAAVAKAVKAIRAFHILGRSINAKPSHSRTYGQGFIDAVAAKKKKNADTLRKARQFADPVHGYTVREVEELCRLVTKIQSRQNNDCAVFGQTHVIRILSVEKSRRQELTKDAISGGWSTRQLSDEIAARFGTRRDGGRKGRVPKDAKGLLVQLEKHCERWRRWLALVHPEQGTQESKPKASAWDEVSPAIQRLIGATGRQVMKLHETVTATLHEPGRSVRHQYRVDQLAG